MEIIIILILIIFIMIVILKTARIVPQQTVFIVERLGKYKATLEAGFHILIPFLDKVAKRLDLREHIIEVPPQFCITKDNIAVEVDGILYMQIIDPLKSYYGVTDYRYASYQLAQTTMRSEIGKMELEKTFEEREKINSEIVAAVDKASAPWGLKVTRHEIKKIEPPASIKEAMEKQMKAERDKRAVIALSEGEKQSKINRAEGDKQQAILTSEGEKMRKINEAEGQGQAIERVAQATANSIREIANAINEKGGIDAVNLNIAQRYVDAFSQLAQKNNAMIIPTNLSDVAGVVGSLGKIFTNINKKE